MKSIKLARITSFISLLLFPITLNFFSPYVSIVGAFNGIVNGSVMVFGFMLLSAMFFRRAWCTYVCPVAAISEFGERVNSKRLKRKPLTWIRLSIFGLWFSILVFGFITANGIHAFIPLYMTESGISVDQPLKFLTYYLVLSSLVILTFSLGKRGACYSICWMSPFLSAGAWLGDKLHFPQYKIRSTPETCIKCTLCDKNCPMSLDVMEELKAGSIQSLDCIQCGRCVEVCPKDVLHIGFTKKESI